MLTRLFAIVVAGAALLAGGACSPRATSAIGETCSNSGDCIQGKCILLTCKRDSVGCTTDSECVGDPGGGRCHLLCACLGDSDCSTAKLESGSKLPFCFRPSSGDDGGYSFCTSVK